MLALAALPFVISDLGSLRDNAKAHPLGGRLLRLAARRDRQGRRRRAKVKRCKVYTGNFQVQAVAWHLNMPSGQVGIDPKPPGIVIAPRYSRDLARHALPAAHRDRASGSCGGSCSA